MDKRDMRFYQFNNFLNFIFKPELISVKTILIVQFFLLVISFAVAKSFITDDTAFFGGDTWEYQSMAVNFAKGHGINIFGGLEEWEAYKFSRERSPGLNDLIYDYGLLSRPPKDYYNNDNYEKSRDTFLNKNEFNTYRTPIYPLFGGLIYKIFGISPLILKHVQLGLLLFLTSFLPLIGFVYWKYPGYISGILTFIPFNIIAIVRSSEILTESLIMSAIILILLSFVLFEKKASLITGALLGFVLGLSLLIKGCFIFLIPLYLGYLSYLIYKNKINIYCAIIVFVSMGLILSSWSIYATYNSGKFILLSTQGEAAILDCNNELTIKDGAWHPEWRDDKKAFYNSEDIVNEPTIIKLLLFYKNNFKNIPKIIEAKLRAGFNQIILFRVSILLIIMEMLLIVKSYYQKDNLINDHAMNIGIALICAVLIFTFTNYAILVLAFYALLIWIICIDKVEDMSVPTSYVLLITNFIIITISVVGLLRYMQVIQILFPMITFNYVILLSNRLINYRFKVANDNFLPNK